MGTKKKRIVMISSPRHDIIYALDNEGQVWMITAWPPRAGVWEKVPPLPDTDEK
jgi:hypothetical protein